MISFFFIFLLDSLLLSAPHSTSPIIFSRAPHLRNWNTKFWAWNMARISTTEMVAPASSYLYFESITGFTRRRWWRHLSLVWGKIASGWLDAFLRYLYAISHRSMIQRQFVQNFRKRRVDRMQVCWHKRKGDITSWLNWQGSVFWIITPHQQQWSSPFYIYWKWNQHEIGHQHPWLW